MWIRKRQNTVMSKYAYIAVTGKAYQSCLFVTQEFHRSNCNAVLSKQVLYQLVLLQRAGIAVVWSSAYFRLQSMFEKFGTYLCAQLLSRSRELQLEQDPDDVTFTCATLQTQQRLQLRDCESLVKLSWRHLCKFNQGVADSLESECRCWAAE